MKYVLGVDGGNTKTVALIAHLNGEIIGSGRGGCGDIYNAGTPARALQNVDDAVQAALRAANCSASDLAAAAFGMAGADWPEDFQLIEAGLKQRDYGKNFSVVNDAVGALRAGAIDDWGVAIANGTGAGVSARSPDGGLWQTSFWQEGGGTRALGSLALRAVYRSELGIDPETRLTERILSLFGWSSVEELLHHFTQREKPTAENEPAVGRLVLDLADEGDQTACRIVRAEGAMLGDYAMAAARKVAIADLPFPLILAGSVFKHHSPILIDAILDRVHAQSRGVTVIRSEMEPCAGVLVISLEAAGVKVDGSVRAQLKATTPALDFFAT